MVYAIRFNVLHVFCGYVKSNDFSNHDSKKMVENTRWVISCQLYQCFHGHHLSFCSKLHQMCLHGRN